jgi:hypothetical protein
MPIDRETGSLKLEATVQLVCCGVIEISDSARINHPSGRTKHLRSKQNCHETEAILVDKVVDPKRII